MPQLPLSAYGLTVNPFRTSPSQVFFYPGLQFRAAVGKLLYVIREREGLAVVFGPPGAGKSTLARYVRNQLALEPLVVVRYITNPKLNTETQLLRFICTQFGVAGAPSRAPERLRQETKKPTLTLT